jgi:hypothetical protein
MDERVHSMFRSEMSSQARPPLDGMAQEVLAKGRRARRARTAKIASVVAVVAGLTGVGVAVPTMAGSHALDKRVTASSPTPARQASATSAANANPGAVLLAVASPINYIPQPPGPKAPTTPAAVLDEVLKLLPHGKTSGYASYTDGAQVFLATAAGVGMIRIHVASGSLNTDACAGPQPADLTMTCSTLPGGAPLNVVKISDNCIQSASIDVDHGQGTVVQIDLATCLAWNGTSNPPAPMAITVAQAEQIAANPVWGANQMDAAVVQEGNGRFANIPAGT